MSILKRTALAAVIVASTFVGAASGALALTSGTYLGTYAGNDPFDGNGNGFLNGFSALAKCGDSSNSCVDSAWGAAGDFSDNFTMTGAGSTSGTWSFTQLGELFTPALLVLKAGNEYALFDIAGLLSGDWMTGPYLVNQRGIPRVISHISFYGGSTPAPVPLPAALPLLAAGLGVFGFMKRRNKAV
jgi:hypothetical protein